jgi:hypothetical protein
MDIVLGAPVIKLHPITPVDDKGRSTQLPHVRKKAQGASLGGLEIDRHVGDRSDDHGTAMIFLLANEIYAKEHAKISRFVDL